MNERAIFDAALDYADPGERAAYLDRACQGDRLLRMRVADLLDAMPRLGAFLEGVPEVAGERAGDSIGAYHLLEVIGEGGFGVVFLAEQKRPLRRQVALKVVKSEFSSREIIARFEAERQALAMMEHSNIARVLDGGATSSGRPFFVMELARGDALTEHADRERLSIRQRIELFIPVCRAIQHAHQKGVIHRDIKPSNLLVTFRDGEPTPKVIDFGVAKAIDAGGAEVVALGRQAPTRLGQLVGTLEYMSPEQAELGGHDLDTRSDVYSLGVVLYELLTGQTPLAIERTREKSFDEILRAIRQTEPSPPSERFLRDESEPAADQRASTPRRLKRLLHGDLDRIVLQALAKSRERRYASAGELADDLERLLAGKEVRAGKPSFSRRCRRLLRGRLARMLITATAVTLLAAIGLSFISWNGESPQPGPNSPPSSAAISSSAAMIEKGRTLLEKGQTREGLLWLAKAREALAASEVAKRSSIELAMAGAWGDLAQPTEMAPRVDSASPSGAPRQVTWVDRDPKGRLLGFALHDRATHIFVWPCETDTPTVVVSSGLRENSLAWAGENVFVAIVNGVELRCWRASGERLGPPIALDGEGQTSVFASPSGHRLLLLSSDARSWRLVDVATKSDLMLVAAQNGVFLNPRAGSSPFSPGGEQLAFVEIGPTTRILRYRSADGKSIGEPTTMVVPNEMKPGATYCVGPSAATLLIEMQASKVATAEESTLVEFDGENGRALGEAFGGSLAGHRRSADALAVSADGSLAAIVRYDQSAVGDRLDLWRLGRDRRLIASAGGRGSMRRLRFDDSGRLWTLGDSPVAAWTISEPRERRLLLPHAAPVERVSVSADGQSVLTLAGGRATGWSRQDDEQAPRDIQLPQFVGKARPAVAFHPSGDSLVVASGLRAIEYSFATGRPIGEPVEATHTIRELAFDRAGKRLLCVSSLDQTSAEVALYDFASRRRIGEPRRLLAVFDSSPEQAGIILGAASLSPSGEQFLTTDRLWRVCLWNSKKKAQGTIAFDLSDQLKLARFIGDEQLLGCIHGVALELRSLSSGAVVAPRIELPSPLLALAASESGSMIAAATASGIQLWELATGRPIGETIPCREATSLCFIDGDTTILVGDSSGLVRAWKVIDDIPANALSSASIEAIAGWTLGAEGGPAPLEADSWRSRIEGVSIPLSPVAKSNPPLVVTLEPSLGMALVADSESAGAIVSAIDGAPSFERPWLAQILRAIANDAPPAPVNGPPNLVRQWRKHFARKAANGGRPDRALEHLAADATAHDADGDLHLMRARLLFAAERHVEASEALAAATEAGQSEPAVLCRAAWLWMERAEWLEALECWNLAVELGEMGQRTLTSRATCRAELGQWQSARSDLEIAYGENPADADAAERLAVALVSSGDLASYKRLCGEIFARFDFDDYQKRPWIAPVSLALAPEGLSDYEPILAPARAFAKKYVDDCVAYHVLAPYGYRAGRFAEAAAAKPGPGSKQAIHLDEVVFRALAQARLGDREAAAEELSVLAKHEWRKQDVWNRQRLELLLAEAKALLGDMEVEALTRQQE